METQDKPLIRALSGSPLWPPPVWLMRQAGRYLPEYRAARARAPDFLTLCLTPELAAEITLQPIRRYGFDAAILFSDLPVLSWALGQDLTYRDGEGPGLPPLRDAAAIAALDPTRIPRAVAPVLETIRRVRSCLASEGFSACALIGFTGAPFTVACYMVDGGGVRDFPATRTLAYSNPALIGCLLDLVTEAAISYLSLQVEAGAETVMLFDSWAGLLPPDLFRSWVVQPTRRIVAALKQRFPTTPVIGFPRLAGLMIGEYAWHTGVDAVGLDTATDPTAAARLIPSTTAVQGSLDPLTLVVGGGAMQHEARNVLDSLRGRPFVFNLGHGVVPQTPPEHISALLEILRAA